MFKVTFQRNAEPIKHVDNDVNANIATDTVSAHINKLRELRKTICFPVINRGRLWYSRLTTEQFSELSAWYEAWLDVTTTLIIPTAPEWINSKLEMEEIY